jgi:hypothetical protein
VSSQAPHSSDGGPLLGRPFANIFLSAWRDRVCKGLLDPVNEITPLLVVLEGILGNNLDLMVELKEAVCSMADGALGTGGLKCLFRRRPFDRACSGRVFHRW